MFVGARPAALSGADACLVTGACRAIRSDQFFSSGMNSAWAALPGIPQQPKSSPFVALKYRSRSCNHNWSDPVQRIPIAWTTCRFGGERPWFVCPVTAEGMYCGRSVNNLYGAGRLFACRHCYQLAYASQREPAHLRGLKNHKRSECGWVEARTCLTIFRRNPRACTGGRMRDGVACTIWPNSDRPSA